MGAAREGWSGPARVLQEGVRCETKIWCRRNVRLRVSTRDSGKTTAANAVHSVPNRGTDRCGGRQKREQEVSCRNEVSALLDGRGRPSSIFYFFRARTPVLHQSVVMVVGLALDGPDGIRSVFERVNVDHPTKDMWQKCATVRFTFFSR